MGSKFKRFFLIGLTTLTFAYSAWEELKNNRPVGHKRNILMPKKVGLYTYHPSRLEAQKILAQSRSTSNYSVSFAWKHVAEKRFNLWRLSNQSFLILRQKQSRVSSSQYFEESKVLRNRNFRCPAFVKNFMINKFMLKSDVVNFDWDFLKNLLISD